MIEGLVLACALASPITPDDLEYYWDCTDHNKMIYHMEDHIDIFSIYFPDQEDLKRILRIGYCESRGKATARNINKDGSDDLGILQFNSNTWYGWLKPKLKIKDDRTDVETSVAVASWLIRKDTKNKYGHGWYHWYPSAHCWDLENLLGLRRNLRRNF